MLKYFAVSSFARLKLQSLEQFQLLWRCSALKTKTKKTLSPANKYCQLQRNMHSRCVREETAQVLPGTEMTLGRNGRCWGLVRLARWLRNVIDYMDALLPVNSFPHCKFLCVQFCFEMEFWSSWEAFQFTQFPFSFPKHSIRGKPLLGTWGAEVVPLVLSLALAPKLIFGNTSLFSSSLIQCS